MEWKCGYSKRIISCNIYPQDSHGRPIYNPFGSYVIRLFVNGSWRAIKIDDFFPVDHHNQILASFSKKGKLWASLLEKAYLKMCSGYDFCGSNTSRDIFIFTGWLPEKKKCSKIDDKDTLWNRMRSGDKNRDVLISISTGDVTNEDDIGLASNHAYAVLELGEADGNRFMLILNPWGRMRWKGRFSTEDKASWTPEMKKNLGAHLFSEEKDNGIFWMLYEDALEHFSSLEMNWNPKMLQYSISKYGQWKTENLVDGYSDISSCPQFCLNFSPKDSDPDVIILYVVLSKMIVDQCFEGDKDDSDKDYLGVNVFLNPVKTGPVLSMEHLMKKATLTNELTYTFKMSVEKSHLRDTLNLILIQDGRKSDLYFK